MDDLGELQNNGSMNTATERSQKLVEPPENLDDLMDVSHFLADHKASALLLGPDGEQTPIPAPVYEALKQVVRALERGSSVRVEPIDRLLTTQQAAELLGISRNTLVRLLEAHEIPFERPSTSRHRRLRLHDVLDYRDRKRADRKRRLDTLTRQAYEDGLYDVAPDVYRQELEKARKS